jgi:DNA-binding NtrC family response regulator
MEASHIADALHRSNGNRRQAAESLGIHPSTLFRKIRDLNIVVPTHDGRRRNRGGS